jgi:ATP-dependent helicase HrpB
MTKRSFRSTRTWIASSPTCGGRERLSSPRRQAQARRRACRRRSCDGPVILLQPRRVAARAIAARIAAERAVLGWTLGREVGWQVRFDRNFSAATRLLVVTEGVLTARLQSDPLLSDFRTIVLDEFHERSIHADLAIALARQAWRARDDLRLVVMSATLDSDAVSAFLDGCPVVDVPGRLHPIEVVYAPGVSVADAAADVVRSAGGDVLCFLPGAPEIRRTIGDLQSRLPGGDVEILPLHGSLDADEQDAALRSSSRRRIIVATNIAETSLTVPGVTAVVDSGLHKVSRYDADRGIDSLETERITADAADQRAGRAGRTAPGAVRRLWDARDRLRPHREPEIHRVDLSSTVVDVIAWGGDPRTLEWFEPPRADAIDAALALLERLGLVDRITNQQSIRTPQSSIRNDDVRLTKTGEQVRHLPLHPRLARMLVAGGGARSIAQACALLSERHLIPPRTATTSSDLLSAIDDWRNVPRHIADLGLRIADLFTQSIPNKSALRNPQSAMTESEFRRAILEGYPDRVSQRREPGSPNVRLASGTGATIAPESGVREGEFLVALDVSDIRGGPERAAPRASGFRGPAGTRRAALSGPPSGIQPRIRIASRVEREWLTPTATEVVHRFDKQSGSVKASRVERYDALILTERPVAADQEIAAALLADEWKGRNRSDDDARLLRRLRFAGQAIDLDDLIRTAAYGARSLDDVDLARGLGANVIRDLDRDAPDTLLVPSGRRARIDYNEDGTVSASVKLQELFGLADTPRIGRQREPLLLALLAPNGRPVQLTRDLRSFWDRTYPEVRKELRGRYPKHPWPDDPWNAPPTARTTKRSKKV